MPKPRATVVISAHWDNAPLAIRSPAAGTPLYYATSAGLHPRYYTLPYRTPDADADDPAHRVAGALADTTPLHHFTRRGLDHRAFIPLMAIYPAADVPVVQLSMPSLDPRRVFTPSGIARGHSDPKASVIGSGFKSHSGAAMKDPNLSSWLAGRKPSCSAITYSGPKVIPAGRTSTATSVVTF